MTLAVCWKCGAQKIGALTGCVRCSATPASPTDKATSLLLSDNFRAVEELAVLAQGIANGEAPRFGDTEFANALTAVQAQPRMPWGCAVIVWTPVVALVLLAVVVGWLYFAGAYG